MDLPTTTYKQRSAFYQDIEDLISPGFLSHSVNVNGTRVALRSPSRSDLFMVRAKADLGYAKNRKISDWKIWTLAHCTWMVNGISLLEERNSAAIIYKLYAKLPISAVENLFRIYMSLYGRMLNALRGIEAYAWEDISRRKWSSLNGSMISSHQFSGFPGADRLGMNTIQEIWSYINKMEDIRLKDRRNWLRLRSTMGPHIGSKQSWDLMVSKDKSEQNVMQEDRDQQRDVFYYRSLGVLKWDEDIGTVKDKMRLRKKTYKELQKEMKDWVEGNMDEHDLIIEEFKNRKRREYEEQRLRAEQRRQEVLRLEEESQAGPVKSSVRLVGYTPEQMHELMKGRRKEGIGVLEFDASKESDYMKKNLKSTVKPGKLKVQDGEVVAERPRSLQERISNRRPSNFFSD